MKIQSVLTAVFLIFFSLQMQAGTVEVVQWIPWATVVQEAKSWPMNFQSQSQNFPLQFQEWKPQALQTEFVVIGGNQNLQISKDGIHAMASGMGGS